MATLGDLLASARAPGTFERWLEVASPDVARMLAEAAAGQGEAPAVHARAAVAAFGLAADEEAWGALVSKLRGAGDPAVACIAYIVQWHLGQDATDGPVQAVSRTEEQS